MLSISAAPPQWQTLICLPDDPCKSLVDKSGALLYYYDTGKGDFGYHRRGGGDPGAVWQKHEN